MDDTEQNHVQEELMQLTLNTHSSLWPVAIALMEQNPAKLRGVIAASAPPAIIISAFQICEETCFKRQKNQASRHGAI